MTYWRNVCSRNHKEDYILETSDMPDHLVREVGGKVVFEDTQPMVGLLSPPIHQMVYTLRKKE